MIDVIRASFVVAGTAAAAVFFGAATGAAAGSGYRPFVTDFPDGSGATTYTAFVTDFGRAPQPPGGTIVIRANPGTTVRPGGRDWSDVAVGAGIGLGGSALLAAASFGVRRRRDTAGPVGATRASVAE